MLNRISIAKRIFLTCLVILLCALGYKSLLRLHSGNPESMESKQLAIPATPALPEAISPAGVIELEKNNIPYILINADQYDPNVVSAPGPVRLIYYTLSPSNRSADERVKTDRRLKSHDMAMAMKPNSQRLTGTPTQWQQVGLKFNQPFMPTDAIEITPPQLAEALEVKTNLQIIDISPQSPDEAKINSSFPDAHHWLPHELFNNLDKLDKDRWVVLVGASENDARPLAFELFRKGFVLTSLLKGGYPAWIAYTGK